MYLFTGSQKHPFQSQGIKWKLNGVDATELCKNKKNCLPLWFVGKKGIGISLLIDTVSLDFSSWNDFYSDTCQTKRKSLAIFKFHTYFYHTF